MPALFRPQIDQPFIISSPFMQPRIYANFVGIGMTVEPAGGSDHPTGPQVFRVDY